MKKRFKTLSDYITQLSHSSGNIPAIRVKEFIRRLKRKLHEDGNCECVIDKLAGDKLK